MSRIAYGLGIESALHLPELVREDTATSVTFHVGDICEADLTDRRALQAEEAHLAFPRIGLFCVRDGQEVIVNPAPEVDETVLRLIALGPVMGVLLEQRGHLVLHASAMSIHGCAVAFVGEHGWGKSTFAGALYARGHTLVADDIVAVEFADDGDPFVHPGFPRLKLWPDAVAMIGESVEALPRVHPEFEKRSYPAVRGFSTKPLPVRRIYVLAEGPRVAIDDIEPHAALVELIRHTYTAPWLAADRAPAHLRQCAALVGRLPIRRASTPRSLGALADLVDLVECDTRADQP